MLKKAILICVSCVVVAVAGYARAEAFSAAEIKKIRDTVAKTVVVPENTPEGWSKSRVNPNKLLDVFKPLKMRKDFVLRAYIFREDGNGNGVVWAMPSSAEFPEPKDCPTLENHLLKAPKPSEALDDVMEAIEGDNSPWSYLAASLLRREFSEFGAVWHGSRWSTHYVLDDDPWKGGAAKSDDLAMERPNSEPDKWKWLEDRPKSYAPEVKIEKDRVTVTVYTYSGLKTECIYRHVDTYRPGKYRPKVVEKLIAEGQGGFVF
jgi:hypothetical protein